MNAYSIAKLGAVVAATGAVANAVSPPQRKASPGVRWEPPQSPAEAERRRLAVLAEADPLDLARMQRLVNAVEAEKMAGARLVSQQDFTAVVRYGKVVKRTVLVSVDDFGEVTRSEKAGEVLPSLI